MRQDNQTGAPGANPFAQDEQLMQDFLLESREHLVNIEQQVLAIEHEPGNMDSLHSLFRSFHTIKGLAGFLEFETMQEVAHEVETLLDLARNGQMQMHSGAIDQVLAARDYLEQWLSHLETVKETGSAEPPEPAGLLALLRALASNGAVPSAGENPGVVSPQVAETAVETAAGPALEAAVIKVSTAKLEYLVDMVGELVISQSMLRHDPDLETVRTPRLQRNMAQLARVTAEVQKTAMAMRMVEIGNLFQKMRRLVRDLARKSGKLADLEMSGEDVELDRTIVEELADPLVHMLRNSIDHGLETPEERELAGKPASGTVSLRASHQAGQIIVEIEDDGRGLNRERIVQKAIERGLINSGENRTDAEIFQLIFEPGFSTAAKLTDISGRGVGMDVVRRKVEKLRGRIDIESKPGKGSRFLLKLPLTLAIIDGLVVLAGEERFIVPVSEVKEMFRPAQDSIFTVENRQEMALVRGKLIPVVRLYQRLNLKPRSIHAWDGLMIVAETAGHTYCLLVDELQGKQEVVIKSLGPMFQKYTGLAGGAILGDGRVGLILEMAALWKGESHVPAHC